MANIRTAVIGIGNMGTAHARTLYEGRIEGMSLSAVCDISDARLDACSTMFPGVQQFHSA